MSLGDTLLMLLEPLLFLGNVATCFLFYNSRGLLGLMWIGWALFLLAIFVGWRGYAALAEQGGQRAGDRWLQTRTIVDTGLYGVVRHPLYLAFLMMTVAPALLTQHWVSIFISVAFAVLLYRDMSREDHDNIYKFGEAYRAYMDEVPRANIVVGLVRRLIRGR
jgi:protein-S-isoprenylcysteine O-methyltransferase Ste14